jgi:hypothetical protein
MAPRTPNKRTPSPVETMAALRADIDELLARAAPPSPPIFVREMVLPLAPVVGDVE